jgi:hypothetical protein
VQKNELRVIGMGPALHRAMSRPVKIQSAKKKRRLSFQVGPSDRFLSGCSPSRHRFSFPHSSQELPGADGALAFRLVLTPFPALQSAGISVLAFRRFLRAEPQDRTALNQPLTRVCDRRNRIIAEEPDETTFRSPPYLNDHGRKQSR